MKIKIIHWTILASLCIGLVQAQMPNGAPRPPAPQELVTINFPNGTLDQIIQLYGQLTGKTAIYPSNLQARIVLQSNGQLTREDAIRALENALSVNGYAIIPQGEKFFKLVPNQTAKQEGVPFQTGAADSSDRLITQILTLRYTDVQIAMQSLQSLIHPFGQLVPFPRTNSLLITDTAANLRQFKRMIDQIDQPIEARVQTKFYQLKHAKAKDVLAQIQSLIQSSTTGSSSAGAYPSGGRPPGAVPPNIPPVPVGGGSDELTLNEDAIVVGRVNLSADERTNQLVVLTRTINLPFFDQLVSKLDIDTAATVVIKSIPLKYAKADQTASLLAQMTGGPSGGTGTSSSSRISAGGGMGSDYGKPGAAAAAPAPSASPSFGGSHSSEGSLQSKVGVFADVRTNSILLVGSPDEIRPLENLIQEIDVLLAQVMIEGIIMEVTLTDNRAFGVEVLRVATDHAGINKTLTINPIDLATTAIPAVATSGLTYFGNIGSPFKLEIVAEALARDSHVTILSRPIIQTSHNEEAKLFVGETRPYITGTVSDIVGTSSTAVRSQYESKEIGLELTVKPLINPDGLVVMDIIQKTETVNGFQTIDGNEIPIVAKRQASSVVSVQNGQMVVLGGLTGNDRTFTKRGIPILRDIPLLGYLFSGTSIDKHKTELMVLLQPTVLRTPEEAAKEAIERRNESKKLIKLKQQVDKENAKPYHEPDRIPF